MGRRRPWCTSRDRRRGRAHARRARPRRVGATRHLRREHRLRAFRVGAHPRRARRRAPARLLRSHACGVGEPYPDDVVRAALLLRANAAAKVLGRSGRDGRAARRVPEPGVLPVVPARGSVGASGDLARSRIWRSRSSVKARRSSKGTCSTGLPPCAASGSEPIRLASKGPLARERNAVHGCDGGAWRRTRTEARHHRGSRLRPLAGGASGSRSSFAPPCTSRVRSRGNSSAANVWRLLEGSAIIESHRWCDKVQDAYALRCAPQCTARAAISSTTSRRRSPSSSTLRPTTRSSSSRVRSCPPGTSTGSRSRSRWTCWRWPPPSSRASRSGAPRGW